MNELTEVQARLRPTCHLGIKHDELREQWEAAIVTEGNNYPYWVRFVGPTPMDAFDRLRGYLAGTVQDHARMQRPPTAFLA